MSLIPNTKSLDDLRTRIKAIEGTGVGEGAAFLPLAVDALDHRVAGGGLAVAALHEMTGASATLNDDAAATLFAAGIAARRAAKGGGVLWALSHRDLFAPALAQAGLSPNRLIYAECRSDEEVLAVMEEGLRHGGLAAVVGETVRTTMAATRRLQLAAEASGTTALMLRRWRRSGDSPLALPSAAVTRWRIGCVSSQQLPIAGIARPRWSIELVRQRGGPPHQWIMESTDEAGRLALPAEPVHQPAAADDGQARRVA